MSWIFDASNNINLLWRINLKVKG